MMTRSHPTRTKSLVTSTALVALFGTGASLGLTGCGEDDKDSSCVPTTEFFRKEVWIPTLNAKCVACHNTSGAAKHTKFLLQSEQVPGYLDANLKVLEDLARYEVDGAKLLLIKPTQRGVTHGGGDQLVVDSKEYNALAEVIERFDNPVACEDQINVGNYFDGIEQLNEVETLRKATLALTGRLPTIEEVEQVRDFGIDSLDPVLDEIMKEDAFYERLTEIYNDTLLTDRYINNTDAVGLLNPERFPSSYWFESIEDDEQRNQVAYYTNVGLAREALNLVNYVVRNDRPYTEILTADYQMFTPFSAKSYGVKVDFKDPNDPWEIAPGKLKDVPHAGLLTTQMFLNRFPTTATNRNRARARVVYKFFLDTDVLKLGDRPLDPSAIITVNPTLNNPSCTVCHELVDPIAATFQNYQADNAYTPLATTELMTWYPEMRLPGFGDKQLPEGQEKTSEQWLAQQIVADDRFARSAVRIVWKGLIGADLLSEPFDAAQPDYVEALNAFQVQDRVVTSIANKFRDNNHNLKLVFKEIIKTDYFRAKNVKGEVDDKRKYELAELGTAQYLGPEQLTRKIEAVTGYPWRRDPGATDYLIDGNEYRIFYGGIDSNSIVQRITDPNGIMANIGMRMANEMACIVTARDFSQDPSDRLLFPYVEPGFIPEDENGFAVPAVNDSIRANIQHLYDHVLGESYALTDPEITEAYNLFVTIWKDGKNGVAGGTYSPELPGQCRSNNDYWTGNELPEERRINNDPDYTVRAWMGVMTFMLSDYKFLHE
jgi:hypothetical protein